MILFYSEFCEHCKVLLETIKRHDKTNMIKFVSVDLLRSLQKPIDTKIHSVPALLIVNKKEYLFGKAVFDYLLLPNRGILFSAQNTVKKDNKNSEISAQPNAPAQFTGDPQAFSLGSISSEFFSSIDNAEDMISDRNYKWDLITNNNIITGGEGNSLSGVGVTGLIAAVPSGSSSQQTPLVSNTPSLLIGQQGQEATKMISESDNNSKLPSLEEIQKRREMGVP
jgi:hypothetical protein